MKYPNSSQLRRHLLSVSDVSETSFYRLHFTDRLLKAQLKGIIVPQNKHVCFDCENESETQNTKQPIFGFQQSLE